MVKNSNEYVSEWFFGDMREAEKRKGKSGRSYTEIRIRAVSCVLKCMFKKSNVLLNPGVEDGYG